MDSDRTIEMFYSASTKGFYSTEIHGDNIPSDVVEITEKEWSDLLDGQSTGKEIVPDEHGHPILRDPPPVVLPELTIEEKLNSLGLSVEELKSVLGSN